MIQTQHPHQRLPLPELAAAYDVIVIGGGPAGATTGALLAEAGHAVLILERSQMPRFHVGESLIPDTYWTLERLGLIETLKASAFPKKYSVQFISENGKESAPFYFDEWNPHESSQTWQVERGEFDRLLLDTAQTKGATICTDAQVTEVLFEGGRAVGVSVKLTDADGQSQVRTLSSRVIVDASGQSAFLVNRLGLKDPDPRLRKGSIWSYWKNTLKESGPRDEGATLIISSQEKQSWFWFIPLPDDVVSIGVTGDVDYIFEKGRGTPAAIYQQEIERCPGLQKRLAGAERVHDFFSTRDFSYSVKQPAGDGWVLVGDAAGFIDPIYSSGVYLALKSGEMVADVVAAALEADDPSADRLGSWYPRYAQGKLMFHWLVYAFYTREFSFAAFLKQYPQHKGAVTDILIGNVFREGLEEMFADMHAAFPQTHPDYALGVPATASA